MNNRPRSIGIRTARM